MKRRGELVKVSFLFDKYKNILQPPQAVVVVTVVEVIFDLCGITILQKQIKYSVATKTISLLIPSIIKQEILRRQSEILNHLKGRLGKKAPNKIL